MAQYSILSTKKIEPHLKEEMAQQGIEVTEQEFITIKPILTEKKHQEVMSAVLNPEQSGIVFTSRHALINIELDLFAATAGAGQLPSQWQVFCLNGVTQDALLKRLPQEQIIDTASSAAALAHKIIANGSFKEVVFFCSNKRRDELPDLLRMNGIEVKEVMVYETVESPLTMAGKPDGVLFFSPSAANSFFSVNKLPAGIVCFAIGETTAKTIAQHTTNKIVTSERPAQEVMMTDVAHYFQHIDLHK
jgi:uroporphyrinogen-III synthase